MFTGPIRQRRSQSRYDWGNCVSLFGLYLLFIEIEAAVWLSKVIYQTLGLKIGFFYELVILVWKLNVLQARHL